MAKSLTSILSQIERLQKEAETIQSEVIKRIRKDIAKYSLTAEQLFDAEGGAGRTTRAKAGTKPTKAAKAPKYADGAGNTWGGMGKRPEWIRQALAGGKTLEDFLITNAGGASAAQAKPTKSRARLKAAPAPKPVAKKRAPAAKSAAQRKSRGKAAAAPSGA